MATSRPLAAQQLGEQALLARAESGFALEFEDQRDTEAPARLLEALVGVDEFQPEPRRQALAERRLAGAHRADQDQVGRGIHARMLAFRLPSPRFEAA